MNQASPPLGSSPESPSMPSLSPDDWPVHEPPPEPPSGDDARLQSWLKRIHGTVADLAANQRDLQRQVAALTEIVEGLTTGPQRRPSAVVLAPPPTVPPPDGALKRVFRKASQLVLGPVRRAWRAAEPLDHLVTVPEEDRVADVFKLGIVQEVDDLEAPLELPPDWRRQADLVEHFRWDRARGLYRLTSPQGETLDEGKAEDAAALRAVTRSHVALGIPARGAALPTVPSGILRLALLAMAAEGLRFVLVRVARGDGHETEIPLARWTYWSPERGFDPARIADAGHGRALGRTLRFGVDGARPGAPGRRQLMTSLRQVMGTWLPRGSARAVRRHPTATGLPPVGDGGSTAIVITAPLAQGLDRLTASILNHLGGDRTLVISLQPEGTSPAHRLLDLTPLCPNVFPLADAFPEPLFPSDLLPSQLAWLLRRHGVGRIVHLGTGAGVFDRAELLPFLETLEIADLPVAAGPAEGALPRPESVTTTLTCALDPESADGSPGRTLPIPPLLGSSSGPPSPEDKRNARGRLGVQPGRLLVAMAADLVADERPEDFVGIAHVLRERRDLTFLLVGRGPLAGTVADLVRYFEPGNLRFLPQADLGEVLTAADLYCSTAERQTLPFALGAALAHGVPAVATAVDGLEKLLERGPAGVGPCGVAVPHAGDVPAFAEAIVALAEDHDRRRALAASAVASARGFADGGAWMDDLFAGSTAGS
ncbi:MAG: glycosyltransferase [Acidobacteriota bacterium]